MRYLEKDTDAFAWVDLGTGLGRLPCSPAARVIDEIWVWEVVHHGDTSIINSAKTSAVCEWVR